MLQKQVWFLKLFKIIKILFMDKYNLPSAFFFCFLGETWPGHGLAYIRSFKCITSQQQQQPTIKTIFTISTFFTSQFMCSQIRETDSRQNFYTTATALQTQVTRQTHQSPAREGGDLFFKSGERGKYMKAEMYAVWTRARATSGRNAGKMWYFIPPSLEEPRERNERGEAVIMNPRRRVGC